MRLTSKHSTVNQPLYRLMLYKNELIRLPESCRELQVVSGQAWITQADKDIILRSGECAALNPSKDSVLVSALGNKPLIMEARQEDDGWLH